MATPQNQISAYITDETKERLERYATSHGVKKGHLIEMALLHHLQALSELPSDVILPPHIVLTKKGFEDVLACIENPSGATTAMKALFADEEI